MIIVSDTRNGDTADFGQVKTGAQGGLCHHAGGVQNRCHLQQRRTGTAPTVDPRHTGASLRGKHQEKSLGTYLGPDAWSIFR